MRCVLRTSTDGSPPEGFRYNVRTHTTIPMPALDRQHIVDTSLRPLVWAPHNERKTEAAGVQTRRCRWRIALHRATTRHIADTLGDRQGQADRGRKVWQTP